MMKPECKDCECPKRINQLLIVLISFSFVCLFTLFQNLDIGVKAGSKVKIPFAGAEVDSMYFLYVGPAFIVLIASFLHIFVQKWYACRNQTDKIACLLKVKSVFGTRIYEMLFFGLPPLVLFFFLLSSRGKDWDYRATTGWIFLGATCMSIVLLFIYKRKLIALLTSLITSITLIVGCLYWFYIGDITAKREEYDFVYLLPLKLDGLDLSGQNLYKLNVREMSANATNFQDCVLQRRNFGKAYAPRANFTKANLSCTNFEKADLGSCIFDNADLSYANLSQALMPNASLKKAKLYGADLTKTFLVSANLKKAKLVRTKLIQANLAGADLSEADLSFADLSEADLSGCILEGAILNGTILKGAILKDTVGLIPKQLQEVCGDLYTAINLVPAVELKECANYSEMNRALKKQSAYE